VEKHGIARKVTRDNMVLRQKGALCMPDNEANNTDTLF
jgi:hypothetical protein